MQGSAADQAGTDELPDIAEGLRKAALVGHVTASVGWLGAVAAFLVLAVTALQAAIDTAVRSLVLAM